MGKREYEAWWDRVHESKFFFSPSNLENASSAFLKTCLALISKFDISRNCFWSGKCISWHLWQNLLLGVV